MLHKKTCLMWHLNLAAFHFFFLFCFSSSFPLHSIYTHNIQKMPTLNLARMASVKLSFNKKKSTKESSPRPISKSPPPILVPTMKEECQDLYFFSDTQCQHRALFMAARLKDTLDGIITKRVTSALPHSPSVDSFWRIVTHRLYTLNYILFVLSSNSQARADFLNRMEADLGMKGDGQELYRKGGMEAHFAVRYALTKRHNRRKTLLEDAFEEEKRNGGNVAGAVLRSTSIDQQVEKARIVIEECLDSESRLTNSQKDEMYILHSSKAGLLGSFQIHIELEEDSDLRHTLKQLVLEQTKNPFEDEDLEVTEDDDYCMKRQVDSGFYDDWNYNAPVTV